MREPAVGCSGAWPRVFLNCQVPRVPQAQCCSSSQALGVPLLTCSWSPAPSPVEGSLGPGLAVYTGDVLTLNNIHTEHYGRPVAACQEPPSSGSCECEEPASQIWGFPCQ